MNEDERNSKSLLREKIFEFWSTNPLFEGESQYPTGSKEFFAEHRSVYVNDCFAGKLDDRIFLVPTTAHVLDAGCGVGMWVAEFRLRGYAHVSGCDLTENALRLTSERLKGLDLADGVDLRVANLDSLPYADSTFDHINCQGVVHHIPNAREAIAELHRVLKPGGSALFSVYHTGPVVRFWAALGPIFARLPALSKLGLPGRGREHLFSERDVTEVVRKYDGDGNPFGISYSRSEFRDLLEPFEVMQFFVHYFPMRAIPIKIPGFLHRLLDKRLGLMIFAVVRKP